MRVIATATIFLLSFAASIPTLAQEQGRAPAQISQRRLRPLLSPRLFLCSPSEPHSNRSKLVSKVRIGRRTSRSVAIGERNRATATRWVAGARMAWGE